MSSSQTSLNSTITLLFGFLILVSSCATPPVTSPTPAAATPTTGETATLAPTSTADITSAPPRAVLLAPPGSDTSFLDILQPILQELAADSQLEFQAATGLSDFSDITDVRIVVVAAPLDGLADFILAHRGVQFLAIGIPDLGEAPNLTLLDIKSRRPDREGFLAGYLAASITPDWRAGVISHSDTVGGKAARNGFMNGVIYYCGLCRPAYPPFLQYPSYADFPSGADEDVWRAAADRLLSNGVKTVYVYPEASVAGLLEYLAQAQVYLITGGEPPAGLQANWAALIKSDWIGQLREVWASLATGTGKGKLRPVLKFESLDDSVFSPGKQKMVMEILIELAGGYIDTGVDPVTGEAILP